MSARPGCFGEPTSAERREASVSAVVVNHDGGEPVLCCLRHLQAQSAPLAAIVVVDSGSGDGSPDCIRQAFPEVHVVELKSNLGPSVARNRGLSEVQTPLVLFVDDDVYLESDCVRLLTERLRSSGAAVAVPRLLLYPETDLIQLDGADVHFVGTMVLRHARADPAVVDARAGPIGVFSTSCLLADRAALCNAGGFDEAFFFHFEDMELGLRLRSFGHRLIFDPAALAWHDRGAGTPNLSFRDRGSYPRRRAFLTIRNRLQVIWLHYQLRSIVLLAPALVLYEIASLVFVLRHGVISAWLDAWWWQITHARELVGRRRAIQRRRRVSDGELLIGGRVPLAEGVLGSRIERAGVNLLARCLDGYWRVVRRALGDKLGDMKHGTPEAPEGNG